MNDGWKRNTNAEYHAGPGVSGSTLVKLMQTAAPAKAAQPVPRSKALRLGSLLHTATLEPHRLAEEFAEVPHSMMTGAGAISSSKTAEAWKARQLEAGKEIVTPSELAEALAMAAAVHDHSTASQYVQAPAIEVSGYFDADGVLVKIRPDARHPGAGWMACLKSAQSAEPDVFARDAINYGYDLKAALQLDVGNALDPFAEYTRFLWVVVEKCPPHLVAVYDAEDFLERGVEQYTAALARYRALLDVPREEWPGYPEGVQPLQRPRWAK